MLPTRPLYPALLLVVPLLLTGCSRQPGRQAGAGAPADVQTPAPETAQVVIDNFTYSPVKLTVKAGTKVMWVNRDDVPHTVTSTQKPRQLDSPTLDSDESFAHVFTTPGTYDYYCAVHPKMTGQVIVLAP